MKFIHTFWSKPLLNNKFSEFNVSLNIILQNYMYSYICLHNFGERVVLYTDKYGAELLSHIPYDDVIIVDGLDDNSEHFAAQIKFIALQDCELGDAIIDGDLFVQKPEALNIIKTTPADVIYSFFEPSQYTVKNMENYYYRLIKTLSKYEYDEPYALPVNWNDLNWMNTSLLKINNEQLRQEYIKQYNKHKQMLNNENFEECWPDIIIEQYFLTLLCSNKYTSYPVIDNFYFDPNANDYALEIGFTHLGSAKHTHYEIFREKLQNTDEYMYNKCIEQYNKYKK